MLLSRINSILLQLFWKGGVFVLFWGHCYSDMHWLSLFSSYFAFSNGTRIIFVVRCNLLDSSAETQIWGKGDWRLVATKVNFAFLKHSRISPSQLGKKTAPSGILWMAGGGCAKMTQGAPQLEGRRIKVLLPIPPPKMNIVRENPVKNSRLFLKGFSVFPKPIFASFIKQVFFYWIHSVNFGEIAFCNVAGGGCLMGIICGFLFVRIVSICTHEPMVEIILSFAAGMWGFLFWLFCDDIQAESNTGKGEMTST